MRRPHRGVTTDGAKFFRLRVGGAKWGKAWLSLENERGALRGIVWHRGKLRALANEILRALDDEERGSR